MDGWQEDDEAPQGMQNNTREVTFFDEKERIKTLSNGPTAKPSTMELTV